jgi:trk system potassium uptake protein
MTPKRFCVIGLGYFGQNLALKLSEAGAEVLAIDRDEDRVDSISDKITYAVTMDSTDSKTLHSLGLQDMDAVIVAIGEGFESSILTTAVLQEIGVKRILNRITSPIHERLLKLMSIDELLVPEAEAAAQLANRLMIPGLIEYFRISGDYGIFEINTPKHLLNKTVIESDLRRKYSLNLITIKRAFGKHEIDIKEQAEVTGVPSPDTKILEGDVLVLFGKEKDLKDLLEV